MKNGKLSDGEFYINLRVLLIIIDEIKEYGSNQQKLTLKLGLEKFLLELEE